MLSLSLLSLASLATIVPRQAAASFDTLVSVGRSLKVRQDPGGDSPAASSNQSEFSGYHLYTNETLDLGPTLSSDCQDALTGLITCDDYTLRFQSESYRGALDNDTLTLSVCDQGCGISLNRWFTSVESACGAHNNTGLPWMYSGGRIWSGYNETCLKDPNSGSFCNDIITKFPGSNGTLSTVSSLLEDGRTDADDAQNDTCSYCNVRRLAIMQESPYSEYDAVWQSKLQSLNEKCSLSLPTELPEPLYRPPPEDLAACYTGATYTTRSNDSCTSIALASNTSSYALFTGNQDQLQGCEGIDAGLQLCIPVPCEPVQVQPNDTCASVELLHDLDFGTLHKYNSWIWPDCSNLADGVRNYGSVVCLTPQGGLWNETSHNGTSAGNDDSTGFWSYDVAAPPNGSTVAKGTTLNCGGWHVAGNPDSCSAIMVRSGIPASLFFRINPSLHPEDCDKELVNGDAYCVSPTMGWNHPSTSPSTGTNSTTTTVVSLTTSNATTTVSPTTVSQTTATDAVSDSILSSVSVPYPTGSASECASFYIIQRGDTCPLILLKFIGDLSLRDLLEWNLDINLDCTGLKVGTVICVGV